MQRISIENFGTIKRFEADVKDVMLLIGPQASGKSTLSKSIFLFKSIKDELSKFMLDVTNEQLERPINEFSKHLRNRFLHCFGTTKHMPRFTLKYYYSNEKEMTISLNSQGYVDVKFNSNILDDMNGIFKNVRNYNERVSRSQTRYVTLDETLEIDLEKIQYLKSIKSHIDDLFEDTRTTVFIPSGRSLISTLAEQLQDIKPYTLDFFMKSFVERINRLKPFFRDTLNLLIEERESLISEEANLNEVKYATSIIRKILRGEYRFESDGERIYLNDKEYVKLQYASSGQQESVWILLLIFRYILDGTSVFIVFEEPEAHLYPETQSDIVELIALLANINNNQIVVTTHSPYILSSFNNLLYAYQIGNNKVGTEKEAVESIVNRNIWLDPNRTSAYFVSESLWESIFDEDLKLIKAEKIDSASSIINNKFNNLFNLDN
ncbi:AAA family ATPase [Nostoc sp.]|uniref:AAA family ATPase n=1 Tax=Nostoc sp. TaxID=1180 RepID=UPI003592FF52